MESNAKVKREFYLAKGFSPLEVEDEQGDGAKAANSKKPTKSNTWFAAHGLSGEAHWKSSTRRPSQP